MGLSEALEVLKGAINLAQKSDNIGLYRQLLDLQEEVSRLQDENTALKAKKEISEKIIRHSASYITLKDNTPSLYYCTHCWDVEQKLVQLNCNNHNGTFICPHCHMAGIYDEAKEKAVSDALNNSNPFLI